MKTKSLFIAFATVAVAACATQAQNDARSQLEGMNIDYTSAKKEFEKALDDGNAVRLEQLFTANSGWPCHRAISGPGTWCPRDNQQIYVRRALFDKGNFNLLAIFGAYSFEKRAFSDVSEAIEKWTPIKNLCLEQAIWTFAEQHRAELNGEAIVGAFVRGACPEAARKMIDVFPDAAPGVASREARALEKVAAEATRTKTVRDKGGAVDSVVQDYLAAIDQLITGVSTSCMKGNKEGCDAATGIKEARRKLVAALEGLKERTALDQAERERKDKAEKAAKAAEASVDGILARACQSKDWISWNQTVIDNQKEIGKTSGYVDKKALYEAGAQIVGAKASLKQYAEEYRAKSGGKPLDLSKCEKVAH